MFRKLLVILLISMGSLSSYAQVPFGSISIEQITIPAAEQAVIDVTCPGARCYRIYICMNEPWWELVSVFGYNTPGFPYPGYVTLRDAADNFYQSPFGGVSAAQINPLVIPTIPSLAYDSFVTMKALNSSEDVCLGITGNVNTPWETLGGNMDLTDPVGGTWFCPRDRVPTYAGPGPTDNPIPGTWATTIQNVPTSGNRILIAQMTTNGIFDAQLSFQFKALDSDLIVLPAASNPSPGLLPDFPEYYEYNYYFNNEPGFFDLPCQILFLPVEILSFNAEAIDDQVRLTWVTESEINSDFFTIERSKDGNSWESIITVDGAGDSQARRSYTSYDKNPFEGLNYYRLRQTDYNGASEVSDMIAVNFRSGNNVQIYPNPGKEAIVRLKGNSSNIRAVRVLSKTGQVISTFENNQRMALQELNLTGLNLDAGLYLIEMLFNDGAVETRRWILQP